MELREKAKPKDYDALSDLAIGLKVASDFGKLAPLIAQLNGCSAESICLEKVATPFLRRAKSPEEIERLIATLGDHLQESETLSRFTEATRHEYLKFCLLFRQFEFNQLMLSEKDAELFGLATHTPSALIAHRILTQLEFYRGNDDEIQKMVELAAKVSNESTDSVQQKIDASKKPYDTGQAETILLIPAIHQAVESMSESDYRAEIAMLAQRCIDVEEASRNNYPNRIGKLLELEENWTSNVDLKKSRYLKWYQPRPKLVSAELRSEVKARGIMCLAAVRRWQLLHGESPANVEAALKDAKLDPAKFMDPYTGQPFKILQSANCAVYSVGPDKVDGIGEIKVDFISAWPEIEGDIVFDLAENP